MTNGVAIDIDVPGWMSRHPSNVHIYVQMSEYASGHLLSVHTCVEHLEGVWIFKWYFRCLAGVQTGVWMCLDIWQRFACVSIYLNVWIFVCMAVLTFYECHHVPKNLCNFVLIM